MKTFKIIASKNNNKVTLINQYETVDEARADVGRQGYAIIEIGELTEGVTLEGVFYFEITTNEGVRKGKIKSDDIFKAYVKLVDDLGYKVLFLYDRADADDAYKKLMTVNIEKSYAIYREQSGKKSAEDKVAATAATADAGGSFAAKREIDRLHAVYAKMLSKAESILNTYREDLSGDLRNDLSDVVNKIKTVGSISNIDRLKAFGEESLRKIGEAELAIINKRSIKEKKSFLEETNKLLKGVGSYHAVTHADDSIAGNLKKIFGPLLVRLAPQKTAASVQVTSGVAAAYKGSGAVKKGSYLYYHVLKDIETYRRKREAVRAEWMHAMFRMDAENIRVKRIKLDLINQNIRLLKARLSGRSFSYVKVVQGAKFYMDAVFALLQGLADLYVAAFSLAAAYFSVAYAYAAFFRQDLFVRPSFVYLLVGAAAAAALLKSCSRAWHLVPAACAFVGFMTVLRINF